MRSCGSRFMSSVSPADIPHLGLSFGPSAVGIDGAAFEQSTGDINVFDVRRGGGAHRCAAAGSRLSRSPHSVLQSSPS